jgi:choline dehydrogenase-like flavoprotein
MAQPQYEYIVVGSGAGGGTVAARLAERGHTVLLLEAGGDPLKLEGASNDYQVPAFHAQSSENDATSWRFFVRHYEDETLQKKDPKYREEFDDKRVDGIFYPRAGCLGGCTAHNAMILVAPHNRDWEYIEEITGDRTWSAKRMRRYFQRLENCHHRPWLRFLNWFGINPSRHGFRGWLRTEISIPDAVLESTQLDEFIIKTALAEMGTDLKTLWQRIHWFLLGRGDPNDWRLVMKNATGSRLMPLATDGHARTGSRERVLSVAKKYPKRLHVELDAHATRVLFEDGNPGNRAIGVEYLKGSRLYRAFRNAGKSAVVETRQAFASREVILAGGTFNTPQLLMLSGIGPRQHLEEHQIPVRVDLPGVGSNLQDRYEVGVVNRMKFPEWTVLKGAKFAEGDPQYKAWKTLKASRKGVYATNGVVSSIYLRSFEDRPLPDLFCFALIGPFRGYYPGYSKKFAEERNYLTWSILKAHTNNTAGQVRLRSNDPLDTPHINFRYFEEGNDKSGDDLKSIVEGIKFVRRMTAPIFECGLMEEEELPGAQVKDDDDVALADYVRNHAWGHHASGTCAIGDLARGGVVNRNFEVHGTTGLRIVDASVFPKIPGFFIVSSVYTIGEKAADVIHAASRKATKRNGG